MDITPACRQPIAPDPRLRVAENHYAPWVEFNVRFRGLPRDLGDRLLELQGTVQLANYESVRRASRKVLNEEGWSAK